MLKNKTRKILIILSFLLFSMLLTSCGEVKDEAKIITSSDFYSLKLEETIKLPIAIDDKDVNYQSSEEGIVQIDGNSITVLKAGVVIIYAKNENETLKEYVIKVVDNFSKISISGPSFIKLNEDSSFFATITPSDLSQEVNWSSSDSTILTIDEFGNAHAKAEGLVRVIATSKEHTENYSEKIVLVANTEKEASDVYTENEETIQMNSLESILYPIIEDAKSYTIGINGYSTGWFGSSSLNQGSGIVYKREEIKENDVVTKYKYYALTNRHLVKGTSKITVIDPDTTKEIPATLVQYDVKVDLAVISFETKIYYSTCRFANSDEVKKGEFVIAVGNPLGYVYSNTATLGIVSSTNRYLADDTDGDGTNDWDARYIQHDASINDGNTGGPLVNLKGEVIGMNSMKISSVKTEDMGFAIPINTILELVDFLEKGIQIQRPVLKITTMDVKVIKGSEYYQSLYKIDSTIKYGLYVTEVEKGGVGDIAGMKAGDVILEISNVPIYYSYIIRAELGKFVIGSGESTTIKVYRNGEYLTLTVTF
mgnify:CR=1 FL=1